MRFRVDFEYGYISWDEKDEAKAWKAYKDNGITISKCKDIHDEGQILESKKIRVLDFSIRNIN